MKHRDGIRMTLWFDQSSFYELVLNDTTSWQFLTCKCQKARLLLVLWLHRDGQSHSEVTCAKIVRKCYLVLSCCSCCVQVVCLHLYKILCPLLLLFVAVVREELESLLTLEADTIVWTWVWILWLNLPRSEAGWEHSLSVPVDVGRQKGKDIIWSEVSARIHKSIDNLFTSKLFI